MYISKKRRAGVLTDQNRIPAGMRTDVVPMEQMLYVFDRLHFEPIFDRRLTSISSPFDMHLTAV